MINLQGKLRLFNLPVSKAVGGMIVDHADGLHESVADGRPDEIESTLLQVFAHFLRYCGLSGDIGKGCPVIDNRRVADKSPEVIRERIEFIKDLQVSPGIA